MPPDPLTGLKSFSSRFAAIKSFRVMIRTSQILGWIRPCRGPTEQHFYVWEPHHGCLHKLEKVSWCPLVKEGQLSHKIGKCPGTPMFYTTTDLHMVKSIQWFLLSIVIQPAYLRWQDSLNFGFIFRKQNTTKRICLPCFCMIKSVPFPVCNDSIPIMYRLTSSTSTASKNIARINGYYRCYNYLACLGFP